MKELGSTYRLQLGPDLDFRSARLLAPYLAKLGITHLYLSPSLECRPGSTHGYDVIDPTRISSEKGGEEEFRMLCGAGLGVVLDIVPNHMAVSDANPFWGDEDLRRRFFDIDPETGRHRRFFDIDDLAGVRVEDIGVFETTHRKILELVADGAVQGLRIDHPDGLADPAGYLRRLRAAGVSHVWVEKILHPGEPLRDWPVDGTTGYEYLNDLTALFVDGEAEGAFTDLYSEVTGESRTFSEVAYGSKMGQIETAFEFEVNRLASLAGVPGVAETLASFPVYRTYAEPWSGVVDPQDRLAVDRSRASDQLKRLLLLEERGHDELVTRFQQTSPPVVAKGVEDTAFYRYMRLLALNEVGSDPERFGLSVDAFHSANEERARRFPLGLLSTTTHDTKRSGDVRARLCALTRLASRWRSLVGEWRQANAPLRESGAPDPNEEYMIFQVLAGAWPIDRDRLLLYAMKALREAKIHSNWARPDDDWERRVFSYCERLLEHAPFRRTFDPFVATLAEGGRRVSYAQTALKLTSPGVPDTYQGDEMESLALVDPDNRGPVDWDLRREGLGGLAAGERPAPQTEKLHLTWRLLDLRSRRPAAFGGSYVALEAGRAACAYMRGREVLAVANLDPWREAAGDVHLPRGVAGGWRDVVSGERLELPGGPVALERLLGGRPATVLERS